MKRFLALLLSLAMLASIACVPALAADDAPLQFVLTVEGYDTTEHEGNETALTSAAPSDYVVLNLSIKNTSSESFSFSGYKACLTYDGNSLTPAKEGTKNSQPFRQKSVYNAWGDGTLQPNTENAGEAIITWGASTDAEIEGGTTELFAQILFQVNTDAESSVSNFTFNTAKENYITAGAQSDISAFSNTSVTINGVAPTLDHILVLPEESTTPVSGVLVDGQHNITTLSAKAYSAKGTDITSLVSWSISPEPTIDGDILAKGIAIYSDGALKIHRRAAAQTYTITATPGAGAQGTAKTMDLKVNHNPSVVTSIGVASSSDLVNIEVPTCANSPKTVQEVAYVYNQYEEQMPNETVTWSIVGAEANTKGISIDTDTGLLSLTNEAIASEKAVQVKAVSTTTDTVTGSAYLTITKAASVANVVLASPSDLTVVVPTSGTTTVKDEAGTADKIYSGSVIDQFGAVMEGDAVLSVSPADKGVTIDTATGIVTVDASAKEYVTDATGKTFSIVVADSTGTCSNENFHKLTVKRAEPVATSLKVFRGETELTAADTVIIPASGASDNPYTYTAKIYDQYGTEMTGVNAEFTFATADAYVTCNKGTGCATVNVKAGATKDSTYTLTVSYGTLESKAITLTAKDIEITWPTVSEKSGTYGDTWSDIVSFTGGSASLNGQTVAGTFTLVDADSIPDVGATYAFCFDSTDGAYHVTSAAYADATITPKTITVTPNEVTLAYGDQEPMALSYRESGVLSGQESAYSGGLSRNGDNNVGTYTINLGTLALVDNGTFKAANYTLALAATPVTYTINPKAITATVTAAEKTYGKENPSFDFTLATGALVGTDTKEGLGLTLSCAATAASDVGRYDVTGSATTTNYTVTVDGTNKLTVKPIVLTKDNLTYSQTITKEYDGTTACAVAALTVTGTGVATVDGQTVAGTAVYDAVDVAATKVTFTPTAITTGNYTIAATETKELTASITPIVLTKDNLTYSQTITKEYDGKTDCAVAALTVTGTGVATVDDQTVAGTAVYDAAGVAATKVTFTPTAITTGNYTIAATETKELTASITAKALTELNTSGVTVTKEYDGTTNAGTLTGAITFTGKVGTDDVSITAVPGAYADKNIGTQKSVTLTLSLTGAAKANYSIASTTATFATAAITASENYSQSNTTAEQISVVGSGSFTEPTFTGFGGEKVAGTLSYTVGGQTKTVGEVTALLAEKTAEETVSVGWSFTPSDSNYTGVKTGTISISMVDVVFKVGTQTATEANALTIKTNPVYGDTYGEIVTFQSGATLVADVNGETDSVASHFTVQDAASIPDAGSASYVILYNGTIGGKTYENVEVLKGTVTVGKRAVTLTSASDSKTYDGTPLTNSTVTASGQGFVGTEGATYNVTGSQTAVGTSANTFTYTLNNGTKANNYEITMEEGDLTVEKIATPIIITAKSAEKVYDGTPLTIDGVTYTDGILVAGDTLSATVEGTITNAGTAANTVTGYQVMRGDTDVTENYTFGTSVDGTLTVTKAPLTITAKDKAITYGDEPSNDGVTYEGLVAQESGETVVTGLEYSINYEQFDPAGEYVITPKSGVAANYEITYADGKLTVEPKELTLTWSCDKDSFFYYNGKAQSVKATLGGTVNGDALSFTVSGGEKTEIGTYTAKVTNLRGEKATSYTLPANVTLSYSIKAALKTVTVNLPTVDATIKGLTIELNGFKTEGEEEITLNGRSIADGTFTENNVVYEIVNNVINKSAKVEVQQETNEVPQNISEVPQEAKDNGVNAAVVEALKDDETKSEGLNEAAAEIIGEADEDMPSGAATVEVKMSLTIEPKGYTEATSTETGTLELEITPTVTLTYKDENETEIPGTQETKEITNDQIAAPITISVKLPVGMLPAGKSSDELSVFAKHTLSSGEVEWIPVTITGSGTTGDPYVATWQQSSFSPVELIVDARTTTVNFVFDDESTQTVTYTVADLGTALPADSKDGYSFRGWSFGGEETYTTLTNELLEALKGTTPDATPNFDLISGGSSLSVYSVTVKEAENGSVKASVSKAYNGTTVKLTVAPNENCTFEALTVTDANGKEVALTKMNDTVYTFTMPASNVTVTATFKAKAVEKLPFVDVKDDDWFHTAVQYAYSNGLMNGVSEDTFAPNDPTTRAMVWTILAREAGVDTTKGETWYEAGMKWAMENGISDGTNPTGHVTREQLATMLYRIVKSEGKGFTGAWVFLLDYPDASEISSWADEAMHWCVMKGVINGKDGKLVPTGDATRAEVAIMLMRYFELEG